MTLDDLLAQPFGTLADLVHHHAAEAPARTAFVVGAARLSYGDLDALMDRIAGQLQASGVMPGDRIAVCAATSIRYAAVFLGALRAGVAVAPLAPSSTPEQIAGMIADSGAAVFFTDEAVAAALDGQAVAAPTVRLDLAAFDDWLGDAPFAAVAIAPQSPFHIIYSSGTTGAPKGIVQSHAMRWAQITRLTSLGYGPDAVTLLSTPLYSNTTMASFLPALAGGGTIVLMPKFDALDYLRLAERVRMTHTMLVPVQYRRIMALPEFGDFDLSRTQMKFATSAPFAASLKADVLARWPGGLVEYFGMTEGGGTCVLQAHLFPDKLHTVGRPVPGHDIRLIGDDGVEVPADTIGEIVGHSVATMNGYHNQPEKTAAGAVARPRRAVVHPHRRYRAFRRRRLPDAHGPQEGHDHLGRLQHLPERPRSRARGPPGGRRGGGRRRAVGGVGRDAGGVRRAARGRRRGGPGVGERAPRQDPAPERGVGGRPVAAERHRQGVEARVEGRVALNVRAPAGSHRAPSS